MKEFLSTWASSPVVACTASTALPRARIASAADGTCTAIALRDYVQASADYGASRIGYNHSRTTVGAGLLLLPWL